MEPAPQDHTPITPGQPNPATPGGAVDPGKTYGIVGFILSFFLFLSIGGLILSIIGYGKSKQAGITNNLALAGIIISAISTALTLMIVSFVLAVAVPRVNEVLDKCSDRNTSSVVIDGQKYDCPTLENRAPFNSSDRSETQGEPIDIADTPVTLNGSTVDAACFSFTLPEGFILSPNAKTCQAEIRLENGTATGAAVTSIKVVGQRGSQVQLDEFTDTIRKTGAAILEEATTTINGIESAAVVAEDSMGIPQAFYYIPDNSGSFSASNGIVTSYMISGPAGLKEQLVTITSSFTIKKASTTTPTSSNELKQ